MATTVTFWWFPEEELQFLDFLDGTGNVMAFPFVRTPKREDIVPKQIREFIVDENPTQLFFGLENLLDDLAIDATNDGFRIIDMKSCVVGYDRGRLDSSGRLSASNLYVYWEYPDDSDHTIVTLVRKPRDFEKWAKKVFRWVRKATPEWHQYKNYRVTPAVKEAIDRNEVVIVSY